MQDFIKQEDNENMKRLFGDTLFFRARTINSQITNHDLHFWNYYDDEIHGRYLKDNFKTESCIFIENVRSKLIVFQDNLFENNIGIHGGAIHINSQLLPTSNGKSRSQEETPPTILLKENRFFKNMAYFEGNAIYIKNRLNELDEEGKAIANSQSELTVVIEKCTFEYNHGPNVANGGAVSIDGMH